MNIDTEHEGKIKNEKMNIDTEHEGKIKTMGVNFLIF